MRKKSIIYVRVSSSEQVTGTSLEFQEEKCVQYCNDNNFQILEIFREEGESAKTADRTEFKRAINYCKENDVDAFVVLKLDRFSRSVEAHYSVKKLLNEAGVSLHSVSEPIGDDPAAKFIETMLAGSAEFDNAVRTQRSVDGMSSKISQGIFPWKPPYGYTCAKHRQKGEKKTVPDEPNEEIFPILQTALKGYARGLYTKAELYRHFKSIGLKTPTGKIPSPQFVDRLLNKHLKFYAGIITNPWTGEEVTGQHIPMISMEEYRSITDIRDSKARPEKHRTLNPDFPLRRLVRCSSCSGYLTGSISHGNGGKYKYYHCYKKGCDLYAKGIPKNHIEEDFQDLLSAITPKKEQIERIQESVLRKWNEKLHANRKERLHYADQLEKLQKRKENIYRMREEGNYSQEEFVERKSQIESEITAATISHSETKIDQLDVESVIAYANRFMNDLSHQWMDLPPKLVPRFQKLVFPEGIVYDKVSGFNTIKLGYLFGFIESDKNRFSVVRPLGLEPRTHWLRASCSTN